MSGWIIALIIIALIVVIGVWIIGIYNSLVGMRNRVGNGWSQIDVLLKQRADLIPNLVETVKGYAGHESAVFTQVTQAREQRAAAEQQLSNAMVNLRATAEAYPDLKANQNFMDLQDQLRQIEDKIAYARQFYNDVVLKYNNRIMQVPTNIIAGMFHFVPAQYFAADEQSRQVPQVNFTNPAAPQVRF